jgi:stage II sporulation protein D
MRLCLAAACVVVLAVPGGAPAKRAQAPTSAITFVISGHGYGHGVGLGQYGALGYAQHGWTYDRILAHYYPGTQLGSAPVLQVRVLVVQARPKLTVSSTAPFRFLNSTGLHRAPGPVTVKPADVAGGPLTFVPAGAPLQLDGRAYRGTIQIGSVAGGKRLQAIEFVALDKYLWGVVTAEMPHDWPPEALKAQAVAARSYALANLRGGSFDLYDDERSQAYGGVGTETPEARAAVDATARQVLFFNGKVADTFFYSSSGGQTADATEVWSDKTIPYLVSVPDPFDTLSPYHNWGPVAVTAAAAGKALHVRGLEDLEPQIGPSGRARTVLATGALGDSEVEGTEFRRALGLRSTWVTVGVLALDRPEGPVVTGATVRLTGHVRGLKGVVLEQRVGTAAWATAATVAVAADGSFGAVVRPLQTTQYRLRYGTAVGQPVKVVVTAA